MSAEQPDPEQPDVLEEVDHLIAALQSHTDPQVREQLGALLQHIDTVHRTGLARLVAAIHTMAGDAFVYRLCSDPAIRLLLMSYDLVAVDRRLQAEEALDGVRGHLHRHGIDLELRDVVGGVVYLRLHGVERSGLPAEAVRHDLEEALKASFVGFQELELHERDAAGSGPRTIPLGSLKRAQRPVYRRALADSELPAGTFRAVDLEGTPVLLARVDGEVHAVRNRCGESPLPLEFGSLSGAELTCSWHGCRYDLRSGKRLDGGDERLAVFPVRVAEGEIQVALGTTPVSLG